MPDNSNIDIATTALRALSSIGLKELVLCGGNRNAPIMAVAGEQKTLQFFYHLSEQSAAYFALGRIKESGRPVGVVVTSGTAVAQLLPACVEAYYSRLPLVLITADRPKRYRGTAAPQSIEQQDIFGCYVEQQWDIDRESNLAEIKIQVPRAPLQLNLCFEEPLIDGDILGGLRMDSPVPKHGVERSNSREFEQFLATHHTPLIVLGRLRSDQQKPVESFLQSLGAPVYAESLSGLRQSKALHALLLRSGDRVLRTPCFDSVIRVGSVPTTGFWRDLERNPACAELPVASLSSDGFSGLARYSLLVDLDHTTLPTSFAVDKSAYSGVRGIDSALTTALEEIFLRYPCSEPALFRSLSHCIEHDARVYLGNSLPIREWDLAAGYSANDRTIDANRGVNGIDGQISTFLGMCAADRPNWCILGDLTTLYDNTGMYIASQLDPETNITLVVINNRGGRIFELLPDYQKHFKGTRTGDVFIQEHTINFEHIAKLWGFEYQRTHQVLEQCKGSNRVLLEINPDLDQTSAFWKAYKKAVQTIL